MLLLNLFDPTFLARDDAERVPIRRSQMDFMSVDTIVRIVILLKYR